MRIAFPQKLFALVLGVALAVLAVSNLTFFLTARRVLVRDLGAEAAELARLATADLNVADYAELLSGATVSPAAGAGLVKQLAAIQTRLAPRGVENLYLIALRDGALWIVADPSGDDPPFTVRDSVNLAVKHAVLETGTAQSTPQPYSDPYGTWISGYVPIIGQDGRASALLGADLPLGAFPLIDDITRRSLLFALLPAVLLALLASVVFTGRIARPVAQGLSEKQRIESLFARVVSREVAEKMLRDEVATRGELREVSVLFADIRGFTALAETMAARSVIEMLNDYFAVVLPVIEKHGGLIDQLVGDEVFAVFGAPIELPDDALVAIRAALDMGAALTGFNERRRADGLPALEIGIGVSTGAVVAGGVGSENRMSYTVLGSVVNLGARLCKVAAPGQILISRDTYLRVEKRVEVKALAPMRMKGITFPVDAFEVVALKEPVHA